MRKRVELTKSDGLLGFADEDRRSESNGLKFVWVDWDDGFSDYCNIDVLNYVKEPQQLKVRLSGTQNIGWANPGKVDPINGGIWVDWEDGSGGYVHLDNHNHLEFLDGKNYALGLQPETKLAIEALAETLIEAEGYTLASKETIEKGITVFIKGQLRGDDAMIPHRDDFGL